MSSDSGPDLDADAQAAARLVPRMGGFPVSNSAFYQRLFLTDTSDLDHGDRQPLERSLDPFASPDPDSGQSRWSTRPATGALLTFEQGWFMAGVTLGELRHSLCLAPGEVTRLAVLDWRRTTKDSSSESTSQSDALVARSDDAQATQSVQQAVAKECQSGSSTTMATGTQMESALASDALFVSGNASTAMSSQLGLAATSSTGSRDIASSALEDINRRTAQMSQATRSRRATQIREVSESEHQSASTRVVANYNHMHALTIQYFEMLQCYQLTTRVVRAERCVYVPMTVLDFTEQSLQNRVMMDALLRVAQEMRWTRAVVLLQAIASGRVRQERDALAQTKLARHDAYVTAQQLLAEQSQRLRDPRTRQDQAAAREIQDKHDRLLAGRAGPGAPEASSGNSSSSGDSSSSGNSSSSGDSSSSGGGSGGVTFDLRDQPSAITESRSYDRDMAAYDARLAELDLELAEQERFVGALQERRLFLNQQMWMRVDDYVWHTLFAGYTYPDPPFEGQALGALVTPTPIGFFGNYVAFRWDFPASDEGVAAAKDFERPFKLGSRSGDVQMQVTLPTEGVFAEAVLGVSNGAEKLDITRFWNWQDSPIPILPPEMAPMDLSSRARDLPLNRIDLQDSVVHLQDLQLLPGTADTSAIVAALQADLFPDRTTEAAAAGAGQAGGNAAAGAHTAGQRVVDQLKNSQDFVVGLANSEVGKIAAQAIAAQSGGISSVGGLLNSAKEAGAGGKAAAGAGGEAAAETIPVP